MLSGGPPGIRTRNLGLKRTLHYRCARGPRLNNTYFLDTPEHNEPVTRYSLCSVSHLARGAGFEPALFPVNSRTRSPRVLTPNKFINCQRTKNPGSYSGVSKQDVLKHHILKTPRNDCSSNCFDLLFSTNSLNIVVISFLCFITLFIH